MSDHEGRPLLLLAHEEKGRVALLLSDHIWLWARNVQNGGPYLDFLRPIVHWLMKEPDLEEEALRLKAQAGQLLIERQTLRDTPQPVTLTTPSGQHQTITLQALRDGLWHATSPAPEWGLYQVRDGALSAFVHIGPANPREMAEVISTPDLLDPISRTTGAAARRIGIAGDTSAHLPIILRHAQAGHYAGEDYMALQDNHGTRLKSVSIRPLFGGGQGLAILLFCILLAWWAEGGFRRPRFTP